MKKNSYRNNSYMYFSKILIQERGFQILINFFFHVHNSCFIFCKYIDSLLLFISEPPTFNWPCEKCGSNHVHPNIYEMKKTLWYFMLSCLSHLVCADFFFFFFFFCITILYFCYFTIAKFLNKLYFACFVFFIWWPERSMTHSKHVQAQSLAKITDLAYLVKISLLFSCK